MKKFLTRFILSILIAVLIFLIIKFVVFKKYDFENINYNEYTQIKNDKDFNIIYVTGDDYYIESFEQTLLKISNDKKIIIKKLDITDIDNISNITSDEEFKNYFDDSFIFPNLIILKNGKIIGNITYSSEEDILNKLESLGIE